MSKSQTALKDSYTFSLNSRNSQVYYKSVSVDFNPIPNPYKASNSIVPGYLKDRKQYTPAFIIPREMQYYINSFQFQRVKFQDKILKANCQWEDLPLNQNSIQVLAPVPITFYCQICKKHYTQYADHLKDIAHLRQARFSKANVYIAQLCKKYFKKKQKVKKGSKRKTIDKSSKEPKTRRCKSGLQKSQKSRKENSQGGKHQNCSTNVQSVIPNSY